MENGLTNPTCCVDAIAHVRYKLAQDIYHATETESNANVVIIRLELRTR